MSFLVLAEHEIAELLPMAECIEVVAAAVAALEDGEMTQPLRSVFVPPDANGLMAWMPAHHSGTAPVFGMIAQRGRVERVEMEKTFNMGVGMVAVVAPEDTDRALAVLTARHLKCWTLGTIKKGSKDSPRASLVGQHPRF